MTAAFSARADVVTDQPQRYANQLVAHLGRKVEFSTEDATSSARFGDGVGRIRVGDGVVILIAEAPDRESLARVQDILGRHLERFGRRRELAVNWQTVET